MALHETVMESPIGTLRLVAEGDGLAGLYMEEHAHAPIVVSGAGTGGEGDAVLEEARRQLEAWFAGARTAFDLPLRPRGTAFQLAVWRALEAIPYAETRSYRDIAVAIGQPSAVRAVGAANGRNPLSIVVPCHRVIGAGGALTGYGGGLDRKRWLLAHERAVLERSGRGAPGVTRSLFSPAR
ncbi:MAG: methylated-DNA--[protein]-cysteine S-methyltransferase [Anaeromyxobacteraceae bacterium]